MVVPNKNEGGIKMKRKNRLWKQKSQVIGLLIVLAVTVLSTTAAAQVLLSISLAPLSATNVVGSTHTVTATVTDPYGNPISDLTLDFTVTGANPQTGSGNTDSNGQVMFTYTGANEGIDNIIASASIVGEPTPFLSNPVMKTWVRSTQIPEFPTVALPVIAVIGLMFLFQRRKGT
jgi:hypothetical protein